MQTELRRRRWTVGYIPPRPAPRPGDDGDETIEVALPLTPYERTRHVFAASEEWVQAKIVEPGEDENVLVVRLLEAPQIASIAREGDTIKVLRSPRGWLMLDIVERAPRWIDAFAESLQAAPTACVVCGRPGRPEPGRWWEARCEDHPAEGEAEEAGEDDW